jgi:hypothetical protein
MTGKIDYNSVVKAEGSFTIVIDTSFSYESLVHKRQT